MPSYQAIAREWQSDEDAASSTDSTGREPTHDKPPEPYITINAGVDDDYDDNDDNDDSDLGLSFPADEFPSLTSIALYCFAIHSIPRVSLMAYTALTEDPEEVSKRSASWRAFRKNLNGTPPGKVLLGGLCGLGTLGFGTWQLSQMVRDWDLGDARHEQLRLDPVQYCRVPSQQHQEPSEPRDGFETFDALVTDSGDYELKQQVQPFLQFQQQEQQPYRRRWIKGTFRHDKEVLIGPRSAPPGVQPAPPSGQQGFHVLTPLEVEAESYEPNANANALSNSKNRPVVWIDRGWVPKPLLPKWSDRPHYYHHDPVATARIEKLLKERPLAWNRPEGIVQLRVILSKTEQSTRFLTPEHDFLMKPLQMFWIDGRTLKSIAGENLYTPEELANDQDDISLVSQVIDDIQDETKENASDGGNSPANHSSSSNNEGPLLYPLAPPASLYLSSDITHPVTHMGYAATSFGMSGASWYWIRKLITKGRL